MLLNVDHTSDDPGERGGVMQTHEGEESPVRVPLANVCERDELA